MKIYITGIAGFLGSHLAKRLLSKGHAVAGCDNLSGGYLSNCPKEAQFYNLDILNYDALVTTMKDIDLVIHTAALAYEGLSVFSPKLITENIYSGTVSVATAAIANKVKYFINCSSMARYGELSPPFKEFFVCNPVDPYGLAKLQAEKALELLSDIHNIKVIHTVPHNIIGTHQKYDDPYRNVLSIFINSTLLNRKIIIYGDGTQKRSFSPVKDCLDAFESIIAERDSIKNKEIFNIGPDENEVTINELAQKVSNFCQLKPEILYIPGRPREVKNAWCSNSKAKAYLNYNPSTDLDLVIQEMIAWITEQGVKPFNYRLPVEIITDKTPKTWIERLY